MKQKVGCMFAFILFLSLDCLWITNEYLSSSWWGFYPIDNALIIRESLMPYAMSLVAVLTFSHWCADCSMHDNLCEMTRMRTEEKQNVTRADSRENGREESTMPDFSHWFTTGRKTHRRNDGWDDNVTDGCLHFLDSRTYPSHREHRTTDPRLDHIECLISMWKRWHSFIAYCVLLFNDDDGVSRIRRRKQRMGID